MELRLLRASPALAPIAESLLLALYPESELHRSQDRLVNLWLKPAPPGSLERVRRLLNELVDRPEWRSRSALLREVSELDGDYLELIVPVAPDEYLGGPAVVGPFVDADEAAEFGERASDSRLTHDTFAGAGGWLVDLFELPAPGWDPSG